MTSLLACSIGMLACWRAEGQRVDQLEASARIPAVHGNVLAGPAVTLPQDLQNKTSVLVVGFSQGSREQVTQWGRRLGADYFDSTQVSYFEIAMLAEVPKLLRGWVTRKIKDEVSARGQLHFLPLADQEDAWKRVAGYSNPDVAYVLLVNPQGQVVWTTTGVATDSTYADLKRRVQTLTTISH